MANSATSPQLDQRKHAAVLVLFTGILTLLIAVGLLVISGNPAPLADARYADPGREVESPFTSAILWLELVRTKNEVFQVLGDPTEPAGRDLRASMDILNWADYLFLPSYSALNAAAFLLVFALNRRSRRNVFGSSGFFYIGLVLAGTMMVADALENVALLRLTGYDGPAAIPDGDMLWLAISTHVKWGALWAACVLLGMGYASYFGPRWALILPLFYAAAGVLGVMSLLVPAALPLLELGANLMSLGWLASLIHAGFVFRSSPSIENT